MSETLTHTNGDTPHEFPIETLDGGPLAHERAEATIRLSEAQRAHTDALDELNRLARAIEAEQRAIERKKAALAELIGQHRVQTVRTSAASARLEGAQKEYDRVHRDNVRGPKKGAGKGRRT